MLALPVLLATAAFLAGYLLILTPFISPDEPHNVAPLILALWGPAAAIFLLWLPVVVAAQTLAYLQLANRPIAAGSDAGMEGSASVG